MPRIVVTRPSGEHTRVVYYFDGAKLLSCAIQRLGGAPQRHWRNERRWDAADKPEIPRGVRAEVRRRANL